MVGSPRALLVAIYESYMHWTNMYLEREVIYVQVIKLLIQRLRYEYII